MEKTNLMGCGEPSDKELGVLMHEVAIEAKQKAALFKKQLRQTVETEISKARLKLNSIKA
jgi:hypothetical protein